MNNFGKMLSAFLLLSIYAGTADARTGAVDMIGKVSGPPVTLFNPEAKGCERGYDVPDAPARAFRDSEQMIQLIATNHHNRRLTGPSFDKLSHPCNLMFQADQSLNANAYDNYGWLTSFYTGNGKDVFALTHNEFHAFEQKSVCSSQDAVNCIEYSLTSAVSHDGGKTFHRTSPVALVAALPYRYDEKQGLSGYSNPSNVIKFHDMYYVLFASIDPRHDKSGVCIMRTPDLHDPKAWRGWDGSEFQIKFQNPYIQEKAAEAQKPCEPIGNLLYSLGSVSYFAAGGTFVAIMRKNPWDQPPTDDPPGVYMATSTDLLNWSKPSLLIKDKDVDPSGKTNLLYPALLDPHASDRNFLNVTAEPLLFTVDAIQGASFDSHKLVYRPVQLRLP